MNPCPFCAIIARELPGRILFQDELVTAFHDIRPRAPVHLLVVPNRHIPSVAEVGDGDGQLLGRMFRVANEMARQEGVAERGYRLVVNCGLEAGQSVGHLHMHLLAGRPLHWPPG